DSDPRNSFHKGEHIELSTAIHAEAALIADAAKKGISLEGTQLYVTTFPCPACAKLIACSGITKLYFSEGYSMLDGEKILNDAGVLLSKI
ncbi:MAG: deoxycytidylate deaminase, partial [Candidatus Pacebacteria bacterium]|nr:deoxycytidylate deaminase [Candidatus Paceibacterota bacterium]